MEKQRCLSVSRDVKQLGRSILQKCAEALGEHNKCDQQPGARTKQFIANLEKHKFPLAHQEKADIREQTTRENSRSLHHKLTLKNDGLHDKTTKRFDS